MGQIKFSFARLFSFFFLMWLCGLCLLGPHNRVSRCPPNEHQCLGSDMCIHMSKLCNGVPDCTDGGDEGPHCRGIHYKLLLHYISYMSKIIIQFSHFIAFYNMQVC